MRFDQLRRGLSRRTLGRAGAGSLASLAAGLVAGAAAEGDGKSPTNAVVFQISTDDRKTQALLLGNAHNYAGYYKAKGEPYRIEVVAFGPGFSMVRGDISMMKGEIETLQQDLGASLTVAACGNTRAAIAESENRKPDDIPLLPGVTVTPSGVVRIAELQRQGYSYLKP